MILKTGVEQCGFEKVAERVDLAGGPGGAGERDDTFSRSFSR